MTSKVYKIEILKLPKGTKIKPATSINNGSNKIDSTDFSVENSNRKVLNLDTKCHIPPGKYLYIFVAKNIFIIFKLLGLQPILFIKNFHAYALIIILKKLNKIPPNSHKISCTSNCLIR